VNGQFRYIEERGKEHALRAVRGGRELRRAIELTQQGLTATQLAEQLAGELGIAIAATTRFVDQLIDNQLLFADVQPRVTATDPLADVADRLRVADPARAAMFDDINNELRAIDARGLGANDYKLAPSETLHVLLRKPSPSMSIDDAMTQNILDGAEALRRMFGDEDRDSLQIFRERFLARYELRFVPLLEALDEEFGVGFAGYGNEATDDLPLVHDIHFPAKPRFLRWRNAHRVLLEKAGHALAERTMAMELT